MAASTKVLHTLKVSSSSKNTHNTLYITLIRTCAHASHGELTGSLIATCILKITFAKHSLAFDTTALATQKCTFTLTISNVVVYKEPF